jgi:hypothetical protein
MPSEPGQHGDRQPGTIGHVDAAPEREVDRHENCHRGEGGDDLDTRMVAVQLVGDTEDEKEEIGAREGQGPFAGVTVTQIHVLSQEPASAPVK